MKLTVRGARKWPRWSWVKKVSIYTLTRGWPLGVAESIATAANFAVVYAFTNWSSPRTYGTYRYYMAIVGILTIFSLPGVNTAVTTTVAAGKRGVLIPSLWLRIRYALIASVTAVATGVYFAISGQRDLAIVMAASSAILPLYMSLDTILAFLLGKSAFKEMSLAKAIGTGVFALTVIALIRTYPDSPLQIILGGITVVTAVYGIVCYWVIRRYKENPPVRENADVERYGKQLTWRGAIGVVESRLDLLIIGSFFSLEQLAVFSVGRLFKELLSKIWRMFYSLLLPRFSERKTISPVLTVRLLLALFGVFTLISLLLILVIPLFVPLLFTKNYQGSIFYARAFAGLTIIGTVGGVLEAQFMSKQLIKPLFGVRILTALAYLTGLLVFIPLFGLVGVIGALYFRAVIYSAVSVLLWRKYQRQLI